VGQAPVLSVDEYTSAGVKHLVKEMAAPHSMMVDCDPRYGCLTILTFILFVCPSPAGSPLLAH
jgi:hypothetical protein